MPVAQKITRHLVLLFLLLGAFYIAKPFLVPIAFGFMLAMLLTPLCKWLEARHMNRALASVIGVLLLVGLVAGAVTLVSWQIADIAGDADKLLSLAESLPRKAKYYIDHSLGFTAAKQADFIKEQSASFTLKAGNTLAGAAGSTLSLLGNLMLVIIYTFLILFYRKHLGSFILQIIPAKDKALAQNIMASTSQLAQNYILGLGMMIGILWIMYGIGFSIIGIEHALFFAILCGLLEIIPYVGNLTGSLLAAAMAFAQGGTTMALWVLAVYAIVQFTQTYFLEPLIVGAKVSINPLCTITVIIAGEMLWGIPGMVLAIPFLGIIKIICDNIPSLQPYGFLIGEVKMRKRTEKTEKQ